MQSERWQEPMHTFRRQQNPTSLVWGQNSFHFLFLCNKRPCTLSQPPTKLN
jgi:hypothetical protein